MIAIRVLRIVRFLLRRSPKILRGLGGDVGWRAVGVVDEIGNSLAGPIRAPGIRCVHCCDVFTGQPIPGADLTQTWCPGNARADTNSDNIRLGYLFSYNTSTAIYKCPADRAPVVTLSGDVLNIPRSRSYNMSQSINGLSGPELNANLWWIPSYQKLTKIMKPPPS